MNDPIGNLIERLSDAAGSPYTQPDHSDVIVEAIHALEAARKLVRALEGM